MKLKSLRVENFRWHRSHEIQNIPWMLFVTGPNACGKTSILEALTWGFCGATRHTAADGKGADILLTDGEARSLVDIKVEKAGVEHTIKRSIPHQMSVDGTNGGVKRTTELLSAVMEPMTPARMLMCMETQRILHMSDSERRKLLSLIVGAAGNRTLDQLNQLMRTWLPTKAIENTSSLATRVLNMISNEMVGLTDIGKTFDILHKTFFATRASLRSTIKDYEGKLNAIPKPDPTNDWEKDLIEHPEGAQASYGQWYQHKAMLEIEMKLSKKMEVKPEQSNAAIIKRPNTDKIKEKLSNLRAVLNKQLAEMTTKDNRITFAESQIAQVTSVMKQCPIFAKTCPLPKEEITEAIEASEDQIRAHKKDRTATERRIKVAEVAVAEAEKELVEAEKEIADYPQLWGDSGMPALGGELGHKQFTFEKIRTEEEILREMTLVQSKMDFAMKVHHWEADARNLRDCSTEVATATTALEEVEVLVEAFSANGIPSMILSEHLPRLEELATQASRAISRGRYEIVFSIAEGELDVSVVSGGRRRPISTLSTSEEVWVSLVIQHVMNQLVNNKILVVDEASILDPGMQEGLQDFLISLWNNGAPSYDSVIVCATTDREDFLPRLTGTHVLRHRLGTT